MTTLMGQWVGEERRQRPREKTLPREDEMGGSGGSGGDGVGQGKLIGAVFLALVVGGATGYVTTINKTAETVSAMQARMERSEARSEGQFNLLTLEIKYLSGKVDAALREMREDKTGGRRPAREDHE